jgi:glycosyltransferase involved in cell wall biosynthesis
VLLPYYERQLSSPTQTLTVALDARLIGGRHTGDTSYWTGLVHGLIAEGGNTTFLLYSNKPRPDFIPESDRVRWINLQAPNNRWWSWVKFPLAARKAGAQVLHTQYSLSPLASNGITTVHDVSFFIGPEWFKPRDRMVLQRTVPASCRRAKRVFAVSQTDKREIEQWIPAAKGKIVVTPNALPPDFRPVDAEIAAGRRQAIGIPDRYVLTVGTRWPRKNMGLAIQAAQLADVPIVVTGQPGWGEEPSGAIATGFVETPDLIALYQGAALYLAPSLHEGFGIPLLEAFACNCPVLTTGMGAMTEVAGGAAAIEPSLEPTVWADRIRALLADSGTLETMRAKGQVQLTNYDWSKTAQIALNAYQEVSQC